MTSRRASVRVAARERARQAKARADAQRQDRERAVQGAQEAFFEGELQRNEALAEADRHETEMARQVRALLELGEPVARVAQLCELTETEVRSLSRRAASADDDRSPAPSAAVPQLPDRPAAAGEGAGEGAGDEDRPARSGDDKIAAAEAVS
jgi:hypothetical protein